jgi:hypothetical protein
MLIVSNFNDYSSFSIKLKRNLGNLLQIVNNYFVKPTNPKDSMDRGLVMQWVPTEKCFRG